MAVDLAGKPIVITGASAGIGLAAAKACAAAGMPVVLGARREDRLRAAAAEIESAGGRAESRVCDVDDPEDARGLLEACRERFGEPYAVVANAGYGFETTSATVSMADLRAIFRTNFFGTMELVHAAAPGMIERGSGHILIVSSCIGKLPVPYFGPYCATKAAQWHMAAAMRWELRSKGVSVSSVHPVGTKTEFFDKARERTRAQGGGGGSIDDHSPEWMMQSADTVARAMVGCLRRPRAEVWPGWSWGVRIGMSFCNAFPIIPDVFFRQGMVKKQEARAGSG